MSDAPEFIYKAGVRYKRDEEYAKETLEAVEFSTLVGLASLDAVDFANEMRERYEDSWEDCGVCRFRLNGVVYIAVEDPSDGYRSHLGAFSRYETEVPMQNVFTPCKVLVRQRTKRAEYSGDADVLEMIDIVTGKTVLEVGTDNTDDYYPSFVASFSPENMEANK